MLRPVLQLGFTRDGLRAGARQATVRFGARGLDEIQGSEARPPLSPIHSWASRDNHSRRSVLCSFEMEGLARIARVSFRTSWHLRLMLAIVLEGCTVAALCLLMAPAAAWAETPSAFGEIAARCGGGFGASTSPDVASVTNPARGLICFSGPIKAGSARRLEQALADARGSARDLVRNSGGGDAAVGVRLGAKIAAGPVTAIVDRLCASSCANYIFDGAGRRVILAHSIVVFHGGIGPSAIQQMRPALEALKEREPSLDIEAIYKV